MWLNDVNIVKFHFPLFCKCCLFLLIVVILFVVYSIVNTNGSRSHNFNNIVLYSIIHISLLDWSWPYCVLGMVSSRSFGDRLVGLFLRLPTSPPSRCDPTAGSVQSNLSHFSCRWENNLVFDMAFVASELPQCPSFGTVCTLLPLLHPVVCMEGWVNN